MRWFYLLIAVALFGVPCVIAEIVTPEEAAKLVGEEVELHGSVFAVSWSNGEAGKRTQYLNFGDAFPRQVFTVQFRPDLIPGGELLPNLAKREVRIKGMVETGKYGSRIMVQDAAQIEVMPVDETLALDEEGRTRGDSKHIRAVWGQILVNEEFKRIEEEAVRLQRDQPRLRDGLWVVDQFFEGLDAPCEILVDRWERMFDRLDRWDKAYPRSSTATMVRGSALIHYAWEARGDGYAPTVTQTGWRRFEERLEDARQILMRVPEKDRTPYFYSQLVTLAMGQGWEHEKIRPYIEECMERWPDYPVVHFAECYRLLPRWAGEEGEWEAYLDEVTAEDTPLCRERYARTVWAQSGFYKNNIFKEAKVDWARTKAGFEVMRERYPQSWRNLNAFAKFAAMADDKETAVEMTRLITGHEDMDFWVSWSNYTHFKEWVDAP